VQENRLIIASVVFAIAAIGAADQPLKPRSTVANDSRTTQQYGLLQKEQAKEIWIGDVLFDDDTLTYNGYVVEKRQRKVRYDYPREARSPSLWVDVSFAVLKRRGKVLARFDDNIYFGMGNNTRFGLFSFLGGPTKQIVISQDIFRGGTQWIVSLSPGYRIIFNGPNWGVGREGDDMGIIDLDHDGVYEITLPITDFYDFQDKLPIARIPLPEIIFKYDARAMRYFPANPMFESYELRGMSDLGVGKSTDEFDQRAMALKTLLAFIYAGKQKQAWDFYEKSYNLSDKEEIRRRVKAILIRQPVYKFIYNPRSHK
jgi:hypothetical protein